MPRQRDFQNNAYPPACLSAAPPWIGFPNTNWGTSLGPAFAVTLDPQVNVMMDRRAKSHEHASLLEMNQLLDEFTDWNDDLLRELAR